mmetsp:Transcript_86401/g.176320  ORF Transcript_86401/g.176320 Transcript_86401/m.176320 type:complete len:331 (+) Transcript_86401:94-1086(+)
MMRPPSVTDVEAAQSHLVLLKSKMRQRRQQACDGRDQRQPQRTQYRAPSTSNSLRGVTWDPPLAPKPDATRRPEEGYPPQARETQPKGASKSIDGLLDEMEDDDGGPLVPCPDCHRSFKAESLEKHKKICKQVFQNKRKQFNSAANRLGEFDNAQELIANATKSEKQREKENHSEKPSTKKEKGSVPKWKAQSLAFRQAILAAKGASGDSEAAKKAAEIQKELNAANLASGGNVMESDMVKCPHCGRTFNEEAGQRHIAICLRTFGGKGRPKASGGSSRAKPGTPISADAKDPARGGTTGAMVRGPSAGRKSSGNRRVPSQAAPGSRGLR